MNNPIPINLRRIRADKGLNQVKVAKLAGISREGYRKIELGKSQSNVRTLQKIARALEVNLRDLLTPVKVIKAYRFRALKKMKEHEQILAEVTNWLEDYNYLESILNERTEYRLGELAEQLASESPGIDCAKNAALKVREELNLKTDESIRNISDLLESAGIKLHCLKRETDAFFGLSVAEKDGGPAIIVNTWKRIPVERWIFSAAHELGHLLLHLDTYNGWENDEDKDQEQEANDFASYLLMPDKAFNNEWKATYGLHLYDRVLKVKSIFNVSYAAILVRLVSLNASHENAFAIFKSEYRRRTHRKLSKFIEPDQLNDYFFKEDRLYALVRTAIEKGKISISRGAEILNLDLESMRELVSSWII